MKTQKIYGFLFLAAFSLISATGYSQNDKPDKKERKEAETASMTSNFHSQDTLIVSRQFVLEADYLQSKMGDLVSVSNTLNFVRVLGEKAALQTGSDSYVGYNGLGIVTTEGNISNYKVHRNNKNLTHRVTFTMVSNMGIFDIDMNIRADNSASATITSTNSGKLTWRGHIAAIYNSRIFKGADTY
jgi:hypothetical protein